MASTQYKVEHIIKALQAIGLQSGDTVGIHIGFHSIGPVVGGPDAFIDAVFNVIGKNGTLVLPGFCWNYIGDYDHEKTPSEMGVVPERARRRPEFTRSFHPTHSVIVSGPDQDGYLMRHPGAGALRDGGPWHRIAQVGGKILLAGVDHRSDSMVHVGEDISGRVYYRKEKRSATRRAVGPDGIEHQINMTGSPCCSIGFNAIEQSLRRSGAIIRDGYIGNAQSQLIDATGIIEQTIALLEADPLALCCIGRHCRPCALQRERY
ncbi:MAG: AAC(3) family N-acetyltransferase [Planctomycetota bacterium]